MEGLPLEALVKFDPRTSLPVLPHWLAQPYVRPPPPAPTKTDEVSKETSATKRSQSESDPAVTEVHKRPKLESEIPPGTKELAATAG